MEIVKWPFLKQDWGIEFESSKGASYTRRMEEKYSMLPEAQL